MEALDTLHQYVFGYVSVRSDVSSQGHLPTRDEIVRGTLVFEPQEKERALQDLVTEGRVKTDGTHYSVRDLAKYSL